MWLRTVQGDRGINRILVHAGLINLNPASIVKGNMDFLIQIKVDTGTQAESLTNVRKSKVNTETWFGFSEGVVF